MPIYTIKAPNGKIYEVSAPDGASQEDVYGYVQQQLDEENLRRLQKETTGVFETGKRAVARGFGQLGSTFTDVIPAIGGSLLGFNEFAKEQLQEAEEKRAAREAKYPTLFRSYKEVESPFEAPKFAVETIGEQAANMASIIATMLATRGIGLPVAATALGISRPAIASQAAARGLTGEAAEQFVAQRLAATAPEMAKLATRADIGSAFLGSYALNAPEIFENIYENNDKQLAPGASLIWGVGAAALDSILPYKLSRQLTGPMKAGIVEKLLEKSGMDKGILRSVTAGALSSIGTEGLTESAQEAISIAAERFVSENPKIFGSKEWDRIMESGIRGAVAGGAFGTVGGGVEGVRARAEEKEAKRRKEEDEQLEKFAAEARQELEAKFGKELAPEEPAAPPAAVSTLDQQLTAFNAPDVAQARMDAATAQARAEIEAAKQRIEALKAAPPAPPTPAAAPKPPAPPVQPVVEDEVKIPGVDSAVSQLDRTLTKYQSEIQGLKGIRDDVKAAAIEQLTGSFINTKGQVQSAFGLDRANALKTGLEELKTIYDTARGKKAAAPAKITAPTPAAPPTAPAPAPVTLETIQKIDDPVAFGKLLGIGRSAVILKADGPLAGLDVSTPEGASAAKQVLDLYASDKNRSGKIVNAVTDYITTRLDPVIAKGVPDATRTDIEAGREGAGVSGEGVVVPSTGTVESTERGGVDVAPSDVGQPAVREAPQPGALETAPTEVTPTQVVPTETAPEPTAPKEVSPEVKETFAQIDDEVDQLLSERAGSAYAEAGLDPDIVAGKRYKGTEAHNALRIPRLVSEYTTLQQAVGTKQEAAAKERMREIQDVLQRSSPDALSFLQQFQTLPPARQDQILSALNQNVFNQFDSTVNAEIAEIKAQRAKEAPVEVERREPTVREKTPKKKKGATVAFYPKVPTPLVKLTDEEAEILLNDYAQKFQQKTGKKLFLPKYEGPVFDQTQRKLAEAGDVNGLLRNLLDSIQDPAIKQVLRRLRSLNLKTKIKIAPIGQSGIYNNPLNETDPDTIFLDPEQGMNAHTFIHEVLHAAISNVLANPNHPLTKQFEKFFISIQDRLGAAYGATDLQEFAAELISNPSFQAVLKSIKAPKSENMFVRIMRAIAEFFGFAETKVGKALLETTALNRGLKFINDAIDITNDVPATAAQRLFLGDGKNQSEVVQSIAQAQPSLVGKTLEDTKNFLSNLSNSSVQEMAFGLLRLDSLYDLYRKELPSTGMLLNALERRAGAEEKDIEHASANFKKFIKVQKDHPAAMRTLNDLAIEISDAQVDVLADKFEYRLIDKAVWDKMTDKQRDDYIMVEAQRKRDYNALKPRYEALPKEVKELYKTIRNDYDAAFNRYRAILEKAAEGSPAVLAKLREEFTLKQPLIGYVPYRRYGDFWLEFIDPDTDMPVGMAFESIRERDQFAANELKGIPSQKYEKLENIVFNQNNIPPTHFLNNVVQKLRSEGASDAQINSVYQAYLAAFPAESVAKQFIKRTGKRGMERDIIRGYNDLMVRWARKLANSEYIPQIDRALIQIAQEGEAFQRNSPDGAPAVGAAVKNIQSQTDFFHNPTYNTLVSGATQLSFFEFMAGNISSAIINLTSLPLMVFPLLTGKFGWVDVMPAMINAGKVATNDWSKNPKYKKLYETLDDHGQLKHTMTREVLEGRRRSAEDYTGLKARFMDALAYPMAASERFNRGLTAIAAFDLAIKNGMTEQQAIEYTLELVKTAHTSGMAVTGPKWMQAPLGRIFFTFKSILWQQGYVLARAFYQAFKGENPKIREAARRQLLATYGMATVFVGVKGMPFYGAMSVMAEILASLFGDEDEPFDFDAFMREVFGEFLYKGAFNYLTNLEVANRAGLATDLVFRDDPRGVAEHGYVLSAMLQMFGPVGSIFMNTGRAVELFKDGQYERSLEAIAPSFVRNGVKGARFLREGALTLKGDPIDEDISAYNSLMQMVGFAPADLSNRYEMLQMGKGFERKVELRRRDALRLYDIAMRSGDTELLEEVRDRIQSFNEKHPKYRITQDSLRRSQRAREAAEKDMIYGVRFNKNLRGEIIDKFFEGEFAGGGASGSF